MSIFVKTFQKFYKMIPELIPAPKPETKDTIAITLEEVIDKVSHMSGQEIVDVIWQTMLKWGLKVLAAILVYLAGRWVIRRIKKALRGICTKRKIEASLATFTLSFVNLFLTVILFVVIVSILGVPTSTFAALLAAGGLAVGMALSGTLQNFAGGVMILLFKPFKVGDYIDASGYSGTVDAINITTTQIHTPDNKIIYLPNGTVAGSNILNFTASEVRRVEWKVTISYGDDAEKGMDALLDIMKADPRVVNEPDAPFAAVAELGESAVVLIARAWTKNDDYWSLFYDINKVIYQKLPEAGMHFPFPQIDVHLKNEN